MTQLTLYHSTRCPYSRRVRLVLEDLAIAYDDVEVSLEAPPRWYETVSGGGRVPCIVHGDVNLVESNVINEYLNETFSGDLMPESAADRAHVRSVMQWADDAWMGSYRSFDGAGDDDREEARHHLMKRLDELEDKFLGPGPYIVGRRMSLADVAVSSTVPFLPQKGISFGRHPKTEALVDALQKRRAWQRVPTEPRGQVLGRTPP